MQSCIKTCNHNYTVIGNNCKKCIITSYDGFYFQISYLILSSEDSMS